MDHMSDEKGLESRYFRSDLLVSDLEGETQGLGYRYRYCIMIFTLNVNKNNYIVVTVHELQFCTTQLPF